jgi:hypothetical protein
MQRSGISSPILLLEIPLLLKWSLSFKSKGGISDIMNLYSSFVLLSLVRPKHLDFIK